MITNAFSNNALLSFYAWLDNRLLQEGQMFTNTAGELYKQAAVDPVLGNAYAIYATPFRSIVWDASVSGANQFAISGFVFDTGAYTASGGDQLYTSVLFPQIRATGYDTSLQVDLSFPAYVTLPSGGGLLSGNSVFFDDRYTATGAVRLSGLNSGRYDDFTFTFTGAPTTLQRGHGVVFDYENGRAIMPAATLTPTTRISGSYAFKDFNVYLPNALAEHMRYTDKPYLNSRFNRALSGVPDAREMTTPCIVISDSQMANALKGLGGTYETTMSVRLDVFAENLSQLENALSLIRDAKDLCFPQITREQWPLQPSGDVKSAPYSYQTLYNSLYTPSNLFNITKVRCMKGSDSTAVDQSIFLGRADVTIERQRRLR